ncbi:MAG: 2-phosphosulfolactate phosphatase [Bacteroidales bacterium]|nr:2-phosphosulfolactate phosphatase [Bacteroidales bacterium]
MTNYPERTIEVSFTPLLFHLHKKENSIVVIVDILRATTAICTAFANGVNHIIPVASIEEAKKYKKKGYLVAGERDGVVLDGADFGNSPFNFTKENVNDRIFVITTTNGTQAIEMARDCSKVAIGSFLNISSLCNWLAEKNENIIILCAGWKNRFNLEDTIFAGAMIENLLSNKKINLKLNCDSAMASLDLWNVAKKDLIGYVQKFAHRERLRKLGLDDVIEYCFTKDVTEIIPVLDGDKLVKLK